MSVDAETTIDQLRAHLGRYPLESHPVEHATVQFNLGLALAEARDGDHRGNLTKAIRHHAAALHVFDELRYPQQRARVLTALGAVERELGLAIQARDRFAEAAGLLDPDAAPAEYGAAMNGLGLAELDLDEPLASISAFESALSAFAADRYPRQRAATLHNLGLAKASSGTPEDLEAAVDAQRAALELATPDEAPYIHAAAQHALGTALLDVPADRNARLAAAVVAFDAALTVFTRSSYPFQHALTKNNLAVAMEELAPHDPTSLRRALVHLGDALAILDPRMHVDQWREAKRNLDRVEGRLAGLGVAAPREWHLVRLLADVAPAERSELLRYRLATISGLPETHRREALAAFDRALTSLEPEAVSAVTKRWMHVLMEHPHEIQLEALTVRHEGHAALQGDRHDAAVAALEAGIGDLEIIQRIKVRDLLEAVGHRRPDPS